MKYKIISSRKYILDNINELAHAATFNKDKSVTYSSSIDFAVSELVKEDIRKQAQRSKVNVSSKNLLSEAIDSTKQTIIENIDDDELSYEILKYIKDAKRRLEFTAKEISELKDQLDRSKEEMRIGEKIMVATEKQVAYEIIEIGLRDSIEGLLVNPLIDEYEIDLHRIHQEYIVEGDWFPFQIYFGEYMFVLDDDGSIYVSTQNLPEKMLSEARALIENLANVLYGRPISRQGL